MPEDQPTPKMASAGKAEPMNMDGRSITPPSEIEDTEKKTPPADVPAEGEAGSLTGTELLIPSGEPSGDNPPVKKMADDLTPEEIKALYEKSFPAGGDAAEAAKKEQQEKEIEKRMHDLFVSEGGKGEDFYKIKEVASRDLTEISKAKLTEELKASGFSDDEISAIQVERYYQLNPDELEQDLDETNEDFEARKELVIKKAAYGKTKLEGKGAAVKSDAEKILNTLRESIEEQDLQQEQATQTIAKIDEVVKNIPRKLSVELGKLDDEELGSVYIDLTDDDLAEVGSTLKDAAKLKQLLYTEEGKLDANKLSDLLVKQKMLGKLVREGMLAGRNQQIDIFKTTFPDSSRQSVGVGSSAFKNKGIAGKLTSFGKPVVVNQPNIQRKK